jgi:hypothetical protein
MIVGVPAGVTPPVPRKPPEILSWLPETPNLACHQCWGQAESNYSCVVPRIFTDRKAQIPQ